MGNEADAAAIGRIGFLTADLAEPFQCELLGHAIRAADELGVELIAAGGGIIDSPQRADAFAYDVVRAARLDGILLCAHTICPGLTSARIAEFAHGFAPAKVVTIGVPVAGLCSHTVDNSGGAASLTDHLVVAHGRREFALVRGPLDHPEADARLRGIEQALERHGLTVPGDRVVAGDFTEPGGRLAAELLLRRFPGLAGVDAVIFANDSMAIAGLDVFAGASVSVPGDVSIAGFDDIDIAHLARSPLTTVRQPLARQVSSALADLVAEMRGAPRQGVTEHPTRLVLRRSCGCGLVTAQRYSSLPPPSMPGDGFVAAVGQHRGAITAELRTTLAASPLSRVLSDDWAPQLLDLFVARICSDDARFAERIECSASALVHSDEPLAPLRDAVLRLRWQLLALAGDSGWVAEDLDEATSEALLTIGSMEALREAQQRRAFTSVAFALTRTSAILSSADDLAELEAMAHRELAELGIQTCVPVLTEDATAAAARIPFCRVDGEWGASFPDTSAARLLRLRGTAPHRLLVSMASQGKPMGYAIFYADPRDVFLTTRLTLALGAALRSVLLKEELEKAYAHIAEQAMTDPLTNLWNRRYFAGRLREELMRSRRTGVSVSACAIDLDGFKQVNDRHGHDSGDLVLTRVAERLRKCVRANDVVARFGGDEFVVLLTDAAEAAAMVAAERVVSALRQVDDFGMVSASVGVSTLADRDAGEAAAERILREADAALLEAKRLGKCRAVHFRQLS